MKRHLNVMTLVLAALLIGATSGDAKDKNKSGRNLQPFGTIVTQKSGLCVADLEKEHKKDMKRLARELKLNNIKIVAAPDDYWYYSLEKSNHLFGVATPEGKVIVQPIYQQCHYCPIVNEGIEQYTVNGDLIGTTANYHLYRPYMRGAFLVNNGEEYQVITLDGMSKIQLKMPMEYHHGYLIAGLEQSDMDYADVGGELSLLAADPDEKRGIGLFTGDGRQLFSPTLKGIQIASYNNGAQVAYSYQEDSEGVIRRGALLLNNPSMSVPPIFGDVVYDENTARWWVAPNGLQNIEPYNAAKHTAPSYLDQGEKMYYQGELDNCISFYNNIVNSTTANQQPWASFYLAAAYYDQSNEHLERFLPATLSFENIELRTYPQYYNQRFEMQTWPMTDVANLQKAKALLESYLSCDGDLSFSLAAKRIKDDIDQCIKKYDNYRQRYDLAMQTLDSRIATQKEADRIKAEQEAAQQAAIASAVATSIFSIASGILGGGSSSQASSGKAAVSGSGNAATSGSSISSSSSSSSGSGKDVREVHTPCKLCNGTGKCTKCNGTGKDGTKLGMDTSCSRCGGHPKCTSCDGRGYKITYEYK